MKNNPIRTCIGCGEEFNKLDLIRVVRDKEGKVLIDHSLKCNGRGAYICRNQNCLSKAVKNKRLIKSLKVEISETLYNQLRSEIEYGQ